MTQNQKIQGKFFPFTQETYQKLKEAKLTAAEWRLWSYLITLIPFGDRYQDLPDTLTILEECEIGKSTFWTALAKLQDFEFFDFQDKGFSARNLIYPSVEIEQKTANFAESKKLDNRPKNWTPVQEIGHLSEKLDSRSPEPLQNKDGDRSQTIQTIQISHTPEGEKDQKIENEENRIKQEENDSQVLIQANLPENLEIKAEKINSKDSVKGEFSAPPPPQQKTNQIVRTSEQTFDWLPPGPWSIDGKLDPQFRDCIAQDWINRFGGDLHQRRADVLSHFKKDPANLPIRWEQYASEWLHRYENTQTRMAHELEIDPDYQKRLIANQRAITQPLPPELNPIAVPPVVEPGFVLGQPVEPKAIAPMPMTPAPKPENGENAQAYEYWDAEPEPDAESVQKYKSLISGFLGKFGKGMKAEEPQPEPPAELERLNNWLNDPVLRSDVLKKVMRSDRYTVEFNEAGNPYQVIEKKKEEWE